MPGLDLPAGQQRLRHGGVDGGIRRPLPRSLGKQLVGLAEITRQRQRLCGQGQGVHRHRPALQQRLQQLERTLRLPLPDVQARQRLPRPAARDVGQVGLGQQGFGLGQAAELKLGQAGQQQQGWLIAGAPQQALGHVAHGGKVRPFERHPRAVVGHGGIAGQRLGHGVDLTRRIVHAPLLQQPGDQARVRLGQRGPQLHGTAIRLLGGLGICRVGGQQIGLQQPGAGMPGLAAHQFIGPGLGSSQLARFGLDASLQDRRRGMAWHGLQGDGQFGSHTIGVVAHRPGLRQRRVQGRLGRRIGQRLAFKAADQFVRLLLREQKLGLRRPQQIFRDAELLGAFEFGLGA
jgi:hypothetical protein